MALKRYMGYLGGVRPESGRARPAKSDAVHLPGALAPERLARVKRSDWAELDLAPPQTAAGAVAVKGATDEDYDTMIKELLR